MAKYLQWRLPSGHYRITAAGFRDFLERFNMPIKEELFESEYKKRRKSKMAVNNFYGIIRIGWVLDRILDKGLVIDAWVKVSVLGLELLNCWSSRGRRRVETYFKVCRGDRSHRNSSLMLAGGICPGTLTQTARRRNHREPCTVFNSYDEPEDLRVHHVDWAGPPCTSDHQMPLWFRICSSSLANRMNAIEVVTAILELPRVFWCLLGKSG